MALERLLPELTTEDQFPEILPLPASLRALGPLDALNLDRWFFSPESTRERAMRQAALDAICPPFNAPPCGISPEIFQPFTLRHGEQGADAETESANLDRDSEPAFPANWRNMTSLRVEQAAALLQCDRSTIYRYAKQGDLTINKRGKVSIKSILLLEEKSLL